MAGQVRVDQITDEAGTGSPSFPNGVSSTQFTASGTGANVMPVGTTAQRPASPAAGMYRLNTTTGQPEWYDALGAVWVPFADAPTYSVQYLVVAGGGGGGNGDPSSFGGGGGAGGYRSSVTGELSGGGAPTESPATVIPGTAYTVTVGAGGAAAVKGNNSVFSTITSEGGGLGANTGNTSGGGGSGGGRPWAGTRGAGTSGQGFNGSNFNSGGAGGGGGGAGSESTTSAGGLGLASSITGTAVTRAIGGGSGTEGSSTVNSGNGGNSPNSTRVGLPGGSGIVIIRYAGAQRGTGGTVTSSGGFTIHTFTSSGTYTA